MSVRAQTASMIVQPVMRARVKLLHNRLRDWNTCAPAPIHAETRAMLLDAFAPEVARLSSLLDRDLSHWS